MDDVGVSMLLRFKVKLQRGDLFIPTLCRLTQLYGRDSDSSKSKVCFGLVFFLSIRKVSTEQTNSLEYIFSSAIMSEIQNHSE